ncbi:hypothetical protein JVU11DRAFT_2913 [Chiua virens]|nr:hypothetical protein JVU11DRAFT_2913 [Chiua virens]
MPLPNSAPLSLQVNLNAVQSKVKHAMIVRMSAETLDALEAFPHHPPLSFDFSDVPGIYIGDAFFPMRPQKESSPHELYIRAASAAKPMAPLKLCANVIGKFMVERQLGDKATGKVRQQTLVAKQQHLERQAILLEHPPIPPTVKHHKRKLLGPGSVVKKTPASDQLRSRLFLCPFTQGISPTIILKSKCRHAVKMVGGASIADSAREDLLTLLDDIAEQSPAKKGDKSNRPYSLKPQTWTEVRPYEWPKLTEQKRTTMARQARIAFKALKIPESDPAWDNVRYRGVPTVTPSVPAPPPMVTSSSSRSSTTSAQQEMKRSAITTKDAKSKSKQDVPRTKGEIQMKDESAKVVTPRVNTVKRAEADRPMSPSEGGSSAKAVVARRFPGSGYQAKKSPQPSMGSGERSGTPVDTRAAQKLSQPASLPTKPSPTAPPPGGSHARKTMPSIPPKPAKREDESDRERERDYERQREHEREKRQREKEKQREEREREQERERMMEMEKREKAKQKEREALEREKQREKEREREEMEFEKRQREKERIAKEKAASVPKRKVVTQDAEELLDDATLKTPVPKRRKLDDGASVASSSSKARDGELPKKSVYEPSLDPRLKIRKEPSSPQTSLSNRATTSAAGSIHRTERPSKANANTKATPTIAHLHFL